MRTPRTFRGRVFRRVVNAECEKKRSLAIAYNTATSRGNDTPFKIRLHHIQSAADPSLIVSSTRNVTKHHPREQKKIGKSFIRWFRNEIRTHRPQSKPEENQRHWSRIPTDPEFYPEVAWRKIAVTH